MKCPCCHGKGTVEGLGLVRLFFAESETRHGRIIHALLHSPQGRTRGQLIDAAWGLDPNGGPDNINNNLARQIYKAKEVLGPMGWTISNKGKWDGLYRLVQLEVET